MIQTVLRKAYEQYGSRKSYARVKASGDYYDDHHKINQTQITMGESVKILLQSE